MSSPLVRRLLVLSIALSGGLLLAGAAGAGSVSGKYLGNDREAKLSHVIVVPHDDFSGEKAWTIVASEKDAAQAKKPDFDAQFGKLGDALVVSLTESGDVFSVQVCHQALDKAGFSSSGTLQVERFTIADGKLSARFFTEGEHEFFGDRWSVDLEISADLPERR